MAQTQQQVIAKKVKAGKVKNKYAAKNKIKKLNKTEALNRWLAQ